MSQGQEFELVAWLVLMQTVLRNHKLYDEVSKNRYAADRKARPHKRLQPLIPVLQVLEARIAALDEELRACRSRLASLDRAPDSLEFLSSRIRSAAPPGVLVTMLSQLEADVTRLEQLLRPEILSPSLSRRRSSLHASDQRLCARTTPQSPPLSFLMVSSGPSFSTSCGTSCGR